MKNLILLIGALIAAAVYFNQDDKKVSTRVAAPKPCIIVIAKDVSRSYVAHQTVDTAMLRSVCERLQQSGRTGEVAFRTIGNPSGEGFVCCKIKGLKTVKGVLSQRSDAQKANSRIATKNAAAIAAFVLACQTAMMTTGTAQTDLNGFLTLAKRKLAQRNFSKYEKIMLINSDGLQSVNGADTLQKVNFGRTKVYACGWKNETETALDLEHIGDINDFVELIGDVENEQAVADNE